jgi:hypothetical protein
MVADSAVRRRRSSTPRRCHLPRFSQCGAASGPFTQEPQQRHRRPLLRKAAALPGASSSAAYIHRVILSTCLKATLRTKRYPPRAFYIAQGKRQNPFTPGFPAWATPRFSSMFVLMRSVGNLRSRGCGRYPLQLEDAGMRMRRAPLRPMPFVTLPTCVPTELY